MENAEEISPACKTVTSSYYAEQAASAQTESQVDKASMDPKTFRCKSMIQINNDNTNDIYLDYKKPDNFPYIYKHEETDTSTRDKDKIYKEREVGVSVEKIMNNVNKKVSIKKGKKSSSSNKKENLSTSKSNKNTASKKNKVVQQKATRKSNRILTATLNKLYKQSDEMKNYMKSELCKIDAERYLTKTLSSPFARLNNITNIFDTSTPSYGVTKQQESNQLGFDDRSTLQYSDYNTLIQANQKVAATNSDPWLMAQRNDENFAMHNFTNMQHEAGQNGFIDDRQYCAADYNRRENENSQHSNFSINPYKLFTSENNLYNRCCYAMCNVPNTNCTWNNNPYTDINDFSRRNALFQQAVNVNSNYMASTITSNNFLNVTAEQFNNPIHYYQPLQADLKKLCYTRFGTLNYANNSGCEVMSMVKENVMSPIGDWHNTSPLTMPNVNNNLTIPYNTVATSCPDTSTLYPPHIDNTDKYVNNQNEDAVNTNMFKDQYRGKDNLNQYAVSTFENILPVVGACESDFYTAELTRNPFYQNNTAISTNNNIMSDTNFSSETSSVSEELTSYMYTKTSNLISDALKNFADKEI